MEEAFVHQSSIGVVPAQASKEDGIYQEVVTMLRSRCFVCSGTTLIDPGVG